MSENYNFVAPLALVASGTELPAPSSPTDGRVIATGPARGSYRASSLLIAIDSEDPNCVVQGPVLIWGYREGRWRSMGEINQGAQIDASAGLEEVIAWYGAERIDVSAPSVAGGTATVRVAIPEVQ